MTEVYKIYSIIVGSLFAENNSGSLKVLQKFQNFAVNSGHCQQCGHLFSPGGVASF